MRELTCTKRPYKHSLDKKPDKLSGGLKSRSGLSARQFVLLERGLFARLFNPASETDAGFEFVGLLVEFVGRFDHTPPSLPGV